jgi:hypothetical protein
MCVTDLTFGEEWFYERDTNYRQGIKEIVFELGQRLIRPRRYTTEIFSGMDGFLNMTGKISHRRRYQK